MAEAILQAISKIGTTLGEEATKAVIAKLSEKVTKLKELPRNVRKIEKELNMMNGVIQDLDTEDIRKNVVKGWIAEVRKLAYHVEDVMDKYLYHAHQMQEEGKLKKFIKGGHYVKVFSEVADDIVQVEEEIKHVKEMKEWSLTVQLISPNKAADIETQRSGVCLPELLKDEDLVGIEDNRRKLSGWLYSELHNTVITVSGMGGLGKTTLVRNVYDREKCNFPAHAWIVVSQTYDAVHLLRLLLTKIAYREQQPPLNMDKMDVYELSEKIKEKIKDSKCLIVLDDVWDTAAYTQIRSAFQNVKESRTVITTRNEDVAALASTKCRLELQPLGNSDSFNLFCRRAFHNTPDCKCPSDIKEVATSIVQRCRGLPLAIVSMGSLLSSKRPTEYAWSQTYNQLKSELSKNDHVRAILHMSYHDMPGDLRNCFLYCSMFPEDYSISRESLVRLWVAEGFVVRKDGNKPEDVADGNLMELIHRNMMEVVESDELGRVSTCKMHDIVRELALSVAKEEMFGSANDNGTMMQMDTEVRRFSTFRWKDNSTLRAAFPHLRTLMSLQAVSSSTNMLSSIFYGSNYLTVLELQDSAITEVPTSVGNLFNLRYIGLRRTKVQSLPECIENLSNLQTLDIKQTKIVKLPRGIVRVKKLRHLLADRYADEKQSEFRYFIGVEAPKGLAGLEELQTLETVGSSNELAEQLKKLMKLQSVWIDNITAAHCAKLFTALSKMPLLSSLLLSASDEKEVLCIQNLKPTSTRLHRLIVRGQWATGTLECPIFQEHGKNLKYLALSWCQLGEDPVGVLALHVPNLTFLKLNNMNSAKNLVLSAGSFPKLKTMVLKHMPDVNHLKIMDGALPVIDGLYIVSLPRLKRVPEGIATLDSLKKLWLFDLHKEFKAHWIESEMHKKMQHVPELRI